LLHNCRRPCVNRSVATCVPPLVCLQWLEATRRGTTVIANRYGHYERRSLLRWRSQVRASVDWSGENNRVRLSLSLSLSIYLSFFLSFFLAFYQLSTYLYI
jgi:hypothetical protein